MQCIVKSTLIQWQHSAKNANKDSGNVLRQQSQCSNVVFGEYGPNSVAVSERPASSNFSTLCLGTGFNISQVLLKTKHNCNQTG